MKSDQSYHIPQISDRDLLAALKPHNVTGASPDEKNHRHRLFLANRKTEELVNIQCSSWPVSLFAVNVSLSISIHHPVSPNKSQRGAKRGTIRIIPKYENFFMSSIQTCVGGCLVYFPAIARLRYRVCAYTASTLFGAWKTARPRCACASETFLDTSWKMFSQKLQKQLKSLFTFSLIDNPHFCRLMLFSSFFCVAFHFVQFWVAFVSLCIPVFRTH